MKKLTSTLVLCAIVCSAGANSMKRMIAYTSYREPLFTFELQYTPFLHGKNMAFTALEKSYTEKFQHEYSFSTGLIIGYHLGDIMQLKTGAWYSPRNYISTIEGTFNGGFGKIESRYRVNYISIPLLLSLEVDDEVSPFFKIGAVGDMLTSFSSASNFYGSATFSDMELMTKTKSQFETMRYSLLVSAGICLGKDYSDNSPYVQLEPMFMFSLTNDSDKLSSNYRPFYAGVSVVLGYHLAKNNGGRGRGEYSLPDF
jgi:hypothetical protein